MMSLSFMMRSSCAIDLDLGAGPLAEQDPVSLLQVQRDDLAVLAACAGPHGDDLALLRLLGGGIGNDDAAGGLGFAVDAAQGHAVVEGTKLHVVLLQCHRPAHGAGRRLSCCGKRGDWHSLWWSAKALL